MATAVQQEVPTDRSGLTVAPAADPVPPPADRPAPSRRRFVLPIVAVLALLGAAWAYKQWSYGRVHQSTDDAAVDGHLVPVLAKASGYVQSVTVNDNDHVKTDSLLLQIDPAEYKVRLAQAEADLAAARAAAGSAGVNGQAEAAVQTATDQRSSLEAQIAAARANEAKARADLGRT